MLVLAALLCAAELVLRAGSAWSLSSPADPPWISFLGVKRLFPEASRAPSGTRRVICVGGSTTAGYPFPHAGFPEWMQRELGRCGAGNSFEVLNRGLPGYGTLRESFVLREALAEKPWAVVFYSGHNEVGERMVLQASRVSPRWLASLFLNTAVGTAAIRALRGPLSSARGLSGPFGLPGSIPEPDPRGIQEDFERRLRKMVRDSKIAGALPIVCVTPVNLHFRPITDTAALLSRAGEGSGASRQWTARYRRAVSLRARGRPAEALGLLAKLPEPARVSGVLWLMGMCSEDLGRWTQAARWLRRADSVGEVATDAMRQAQRRVAREEGAVLVDLEEAFSAGTPAGLPDEKYFVDSHHLSLIGYRFAARRIVAALASRELAAKTCPLAWDERRPERMLAELGLKPDYEAVPAGLLANEYALYGASGDPWFQEQAVALLAKGLRADSPGARARLRLDSPPVRQVLARAFAALREAKVRGD